MSEMRELKPAVPIDAKLEEMFCYAIRYSIGRQSYAVESTIQYLKPVLPYVRDIELYIWARDIAKAFPPEEEALLNEQREDGWTASYFRMLWLDFLKDIQEEQLRRRKMQEEEIIQPELRQLEDSFLGKRATKRKEK